MEGIFARDRISHPDTMVMGLCPFQRNDFGGVGGGGGASFNGHRFLRGVAVSRRPPSPCCSIINTR